MPTLRRTPKDALGAPIAGTELYEPIVPYTLGSNVYSLEYQLRGDHAAVQAAPHLWMPARTDWETKRRVRVTAITPTPVDHSDPRPSSKPIPLERQAIAVDAFTSGADFVPRGAVLDIDHPLVKRFPELFRRAPQPIRPEAA